MCVILIFLDLPKPCIQGRKSGSSITDQKRNDWTTAVTGGWRGVWVHWSTSNTSDNAGQDKNYMPLVEYVCTCRVAECHGRPVSSCVAQPHARSFLPVCCTATMCHYRCSMRSWLRPVNIWVSWLWILSNRELISELMCNINFLVINQLPFRSCVCSASLFIAFMFLGSPFYLYKLESCVWEDWTEAQPLMAA